MKWGHTTSSGLQQDIRKCYRTLSLLLLPSYTMREHLICKKKHKLHKQQQAQIMKNYLMTVLLKLHARKEYHNSPTIKSVSGATASRAHLNSNWESGLFWCMRRYSGFALIFVGDGLRENSFN